MTDDPVNPANAGEVQDTRFKPGQSGNPAGKKAGTRNKATEAMMTLLDGQTEALTRKAVELALAGDTTALKLCLDRLCPVPKSAAQPVQVDLGGHNSMADIARAFVTAAAEGKIPPDIAAQMVSAVASAAKVEDMENLKERLETLERVLKENK
jgi:hypothetical protein